MRRFFTILVGFCVVAAGFFGGFSADVFREASSAAPGHTLARLGRVPGNVALALRPTPASAAADGRGGANTLSLYDTYTDVMNTIQTQYYPTGAGGNAAGNDNKAGTARAATGGVPSSTKLTYAAIRGMLRSLGDPYTVFWQPDEFKAQMDDARGEFFGIGASLDVNEKKQVYIVEPIEKSPAERAGILRGDVILAVDNKTVIGLNISSVVNRIKGKRGVPVLLTLQRGKEVVNLKIVRDVIQAPVIKARMQDPEAKIGYIQLLQFNEQADRQFGERLSALEKQGMKALIFDLRGNPGGLLTMAEDVGSRFIPEGPIVIVQEKNGREERHSVNQNKHRGSKLTSGAYPLVVLINGGSASASEIVAGAIKDHRRGTLVGTRTYGKGLVQTIIPVSGNGAVKVTTQRYFTPNHVDINKKVDENGKQISGGIAPDIEIDISEKDVEKMREAYKKNPDDYGHDPQINKALSVIKDQLTGKLPRPVAVPATTSTTTAQK